MGLGWFRKKQWACYLGCRKACAQPFCKFDIHVYRLAWDVYGSGLRTFSDGFGMVLEKMSDGVENFFFKNDREYLS